MRGMLALVACGLIIAACANPNRIGINPDRGTLILGLDRAEELGTAPFVVQVRAVGPSGEVEALLPRYGRGAFAELPARRLFRERPQTLFAFDLEPGEYVIAKIGLGVDIDRTSEWLRPRNPDEALNRQLGNGIAALVKEAREASEGEPIEYVNGNTPAADAPRFSVRRGEVLYIGDILIGAEYRENPAEVAPTPDERNRLGATVYRHTRLFAEYALDETAARRFAGTLGIGQRPFRSQPIRLSDGERILFPNDSKPPKDATRLTVVRARPGPPLAVQFVTPVVASGPPAPPPAGTRSLMERFLAGELSKDEYDRERARRAAGP